MDSLGLAAIASPAGRVSPQVSLRAILENTQLKPVLNGNLRILLQFIEQRPDRARHLAQELATLPTKSVFRFEVKQGDFAIHLVG